MRWLSGLAAGVLSIVLVATFFGRDRLASQSHAPAMAVDPAELAEARSRDIALFEQRAEEDPWSAADRMILAQLFMQRSRETGSHDDVLRAEEFARRSLELRQVNNVRAHGVLAMSLLEQHRFEEARDAMAQLVAAEPENMAFRAGYGETLLELGAYPQAAEVFTSLEPHRSHLDVAPRLARWLELTGRSGDALALLYDTRDLALADVRLSAESLAWFHLRLGDLELRNGRLDEAEEAFRTGLAYLPDDYRLLSAMARLTAARGDLDGAVAYGERVLGKILDPTTLVLLSEINIARGDLESAAEYANVMTVATQGQEENFHRQWTLFFLDRGERVAEMLIRAQDEIEVRKDIYGYDVLAWALHKNGRNDAAWEAMTEALRLGTADPLLLFHAGIIEAARGNGDASDRYLREALSIDPQFHPLHADESRERLSANAPWAPLKRLLNL